MAGIILPKRLKEARLESGLSQRALGIRAGFDEFGASARMNQYERGAHAPKFGTMERIAAALGVDPAYFYCNDDELAKLIKKYSKLNGRQRRKLAESGGD